jgi:hypothetical protein
MANAVAEKKKNEVAPVDALLSMFEAASSEGLENLTQDDLALPFLKILSGLDPILDDREDARKGDIYNTVTGQIYNSVGSSRLRKRRTPERVLYLGRDAEDGTLLGRQQGIRGRRRR